MYRFIHTALLFAGVALSVQLAIAQDQPAKGGVQFEHELSWTAILAKAKAEHKYIFVDGFTTWCGPCRFMRTTIFPQKEVGDYLNDKFICVEVQLDTTAKDNDHVKNWYADAHALMKQYKIAAFPTYLVFTPEGQALHRMVGSTPDAASFIAEVHNSFDSTKQYYTQIQQYEAGRRDSAFLRRLTVVSFDLYDLANGQRLAQAYLGTQSDLFQPGAIDIILLSTIRSRDKYFDFLVKHSTEIDKVKGPGKAESQIRNIILHEGTGVRHGDNRQPKWDSLQSAIAGKIGAANAAELTARMKLNFYLGRADWPQFEKAMVGYMKTYGKQMGDDDLNGIAWTVFQSCSDMSCVTAVLDWSKQLRDGKNAGCMDTYANILYKLGKKDDAIALEEKAIQLVPLANRGDFQATLDKMKKGEKTWN
jgi:thioredoxin-related protein